MKPYVDDRQNSHFVRIFSEDVDPIELKWHRDLCDRRVESINETDWMIQLENQLPEKITVNFIPKEVWHRLIKGTGKLKVKIYEI